jgi:hypothetical protein
MAKDSQINIKIESSQKDRWDEHAQENPQYKSLTNLIELAVERQISQDTGDEYTIENDIDFMLERLDELQEKQEVLEENQETLKSTKSTSLEIEEAVERLETFMRTRMIDDDSE